MSALPPARYTGARQPGIDQDDAFELILPYLLQVKELGYQTFVECTPSHN